MSKKTSILILVLLLLGAWVYFWIGYIIPEKEPNSIILEPEWIINEGTGSIGDVLPSNSWEQQEPIGWVEIDIDNLWTDTYAGGGEYAVFTDEVAKDALMKRKNIILYFYAPWDPTDELLDKDITKMQERIPENVIILKINIDTNTKLTEAYEISNQNTLVYLNPDWTENKRRANWITLLSEIVTAYFDK